MYFIELLGGKVLARKLSTSRADQYSECLEVIMLLLRIQVNRGASDFPASHLGLIAPLCDNPYCHSDSLTIGR